MSNGDFTQLNHKSLLCEYQKVLIGGMVTFTRHGFAHFFFIN